EMLARAHAVPEGRPVVVSETRLLGDLPVDGRHADEGRRGVAGDEPGPDRRVAPALVHDRGVAAVERVHEAGAEDVGPVELARVEHAVAFGAEVEPVGRGGLPAEERAMRMEDALRIAAR